MRKKVWAAIQALTDPSLYPGYTNTFGNEDFCHRVRGRCELEGKYEELLLTCGEAKGRYLQGLRQWLRNSLPGYRALADDAFLKLVADAGFNDMCTHFTAAEFSRAVEAMQGFYSRLAECRADALSALYESVPAACHGVSTAEEFTENLEAVEWANMVSSAADAYGFIFGSVPGGRYKERYDVLARLAGQYGIFDRGPPWSWTHLFSRTILLNQPDHVRSAVLDLIMAQTSGAWPKLPLQGQKELLSDISLRHKLSNSEADLLSQAAYAPEHSYTEANPSDAAVPGVITVVTHLKNLSRSAYERGDMIDAAEMFYRMNRFDLTAAIISGCPSEKVGDSIVAGSGFFDVTLPRVMSPVDMYNSLLSGVSFRSFRSWRTASKKYSIAALNRMVSELASNLGVEMESVSGAYDSGDMKRVSSLSITLKVFCGI
jgi:hypothetical protein